MDVIEPPLQGDSAREAIDALKGYVYQVYQSALAWIELGPEEFLFLEVAEDYAVVASNALIAVQVKETRRDVTINSNEIVASIDSFISLKKKNPQLQVRLRHLTTSRIGKEKSPRHRIGAAPTLEIWRKLAKIGDLAPLRKILATSKISKQSKDYIRGLGDTEFREEFLKRIHFDCGAADSRFIIYQLRSKLSRLVTERGGAHSQVDSCLNSVLMFVLHKATQKESRFVERNMLEDLLDKVTQIPVNRAQFEEQNKLINRALTASVSQANNLATARLAEPRPIDEVPFPSAIASRAIQIGSIETSLKKYGMSWIFGAAGVGKTLSAKLAARRLGGNWSSINFRGLNAEQVGAILSDALDALTQLQIDGLLIDDLECLFEPHIVDRLLYLRFVCDRADILLLITSPKKPNSDFLFSANLSAFIGQKLGEFSESDVGEILVHFGVNEAGWAKYIYIVSGGGHPQLAIAAIQSMQNRGWDQNELKTLSSLFDGNAEIESVRARTRERLLSELPEGGRRLLERLSLKSGGFRRDFVLDMAQVRPEVPDGGIIFDGLIGTWVDQQERDRFALSPLLSNFAVNTLTDKQRREINFEIAGSLAKERSIDPVEANAALIAAFAGSNAQVIADLSAAVLSSDQNDLAGIAPHLMMFTLMRDDIFAYESDPVVSQMFRGAQLVLVCHEDAEATEKVEKLLIRFSAESDRVGDKTSRDCMALLVYTKLLFSEPRFGAIPNFWDVLIKLNHLLDDQDGSLPIDAKSELDLQDVGGASFLAIMFANQMRQVRRINDLIPVFEFLNSCGRELRDKLLKPYGQPDFKFDMLMSGAWLSEHDAKTVDSHEHSRVFAILEDLAMSWGHVELAICCRKYRVIIISEYSDDSDQVFSVLDEGLKLYGESNAELIRAKAKALYLTEDHRKSLALSVELIEGGAPLGGIEKAYLCRDAAISAEKQFDYETARRYFLLGSRAADECAISEMRPMQIGLRADAALASWHAGDRETCLRDFVEILNELNTLDPKDSLRATHCHAVCRHVLLWLDQDASGEKRLLSDGEGISIYPGIVSNPEPHPEIAGRVITPIDLTWYMLAVVESNCFLDVGVASSLESYLPRGPIVEGELRLATSRMKSSFVLPNAELFFMGLGKAVAGAVYIKKQGGCENALNHVSLTYQSIPSPAPGHLIDLADSIEPYILSFAANCIFLESIVEFDRLVYALEYGEGLDVRDEVLSCLKGSSSSVDYNTSMASLLSVHRKALEVNEILAPARIFEFALKALQFAVQTGESEVVAKSAFGWLKAKWGFISRHQRSLICHAAYFGSAIDKACAESGDSYVRSVAGLLRALLPVMGLRDESKIRGIIDGILAAKNLAI